MRRKQFLTTVLSLLLCACLLAGCSFWDNITMSENLQGEAEPEPQSESEAPLPTLLPTETPMPVVTAEIPEEEKSDVPEGMTRSILTGEYVPEAIGKRRPVACVIDNVPGAFPHYGIGAASVYYDGPVEAELTRELAVFENYDDLERIGSLRSCRDYFLSYALGFNSIFVHYGQAAYALVYLESDQVNNISGLKGYGTNYFFRTSDLKSPHNAHTSGSQINAAIENLKYEKNLPENFTGNFQFQKVGEKIDMSAGADAAYVAPGYPTSKPWFEYDPSTGLYNRFQYGEAEIDGQTGEQLKVSNIILEFDNASLYQDSLYVHFRLAGSGQGKYITEGKAIDILWSRDDYYSPVRYYLADGTPLLMNTGKTWVSIIKNSNISSCVMGASRDSASCVVPQEVQQKLIAENELWHANFKANEATERAELDALHAEELRAHGGISKVQ